MAERRLACRRAGLLPFGVAGLRAICRSTEHRALDATRTWSTQVRLPANEVAEPGEIDHSFTALKPSREFGQKAGAFFARAQAV